MKTSKYMYLGICFIGSLWCYFNEIDKKDIIIHNQVKLSAATDAGFKDENFYSCVLDAAGKTAGTVLTDEELLGITELICKNKKVSDITGIEKMSNLVSLNLMENNLSNVDISKNTNLTYVELSGNLDIISIDLTKNTKLKEIYFKNDSLKSIDISKNTSLENLHIGSNELTSIDLSNNPNLKYVVLSANKLTSVDLSKNTYLVEFYASSNQLSSLDLTNNTNIERMDVSLNKIGSINLSKLTKLKSVSISANKLNSLDVSNNILLESLYASSNNLSSINISMLSNLINLDLHGNKISNIDLSNNTELTHLLLSTNQLSTIDLSKNVNIEELYISSNNLTSLDLSKLTKLTYLNAVLNRFDTAPKVNSNNIVGLAVEANWLDDYDFNVFSKLNSLRVVDYYIVPVYGTSFDVSNLSRYKSNNVTYKENVMYSDFNERGSSYISNASTIKGSVNGKAEYTICSTNISGYHNTCGKDLPTNVEFKYDDNVIVNGIDNYSGKLFYEGYREFRFVTLASDKYVIDEDKSIIDVGGDSDDVIKQNIKNSLNRSVLEINGDKLSLKYNGNSIREFTLQRVDAIPTGSLTMYLVIGIMIIGIIGIFISKNVTSKNKI